MAGILGGLPQQPGIMGPVVPWQSNPVITALGASLLAGRTPRQGFENFAQALPGAMVTKVGMQDRMLAAQEKAEDKAAREAKIAQMNEMIKAWPGLSPEQRALFSTQPELFGEFAVGQMQGPKVPTSVQEYLYGEQDPGFRQWQLDQKKAGGTNVITNVAGEGGADGALRTQLSKDEGTRWSTIQKTGNIAASRAQDFEVLGELLKVAPQGPITGKLAEMFPGFSSAGDAVNAIVYRLAPTLRVEGSGATSDLEYNGMLSSIPSLSKNPMGNQIILETMKAKADIDMQRAAIVSAYQNEEMTAAEARKAMMELDRVSILTPQARALITQSSGVTPSDDAPPASFEGDPADWQYMTPEQKALFQ